MQSLESLRSAIDAIPRRGRGRRFPAPLKAAVVRYVVAERQRGVRTAVLANALSIPWETLRRWTADAAPVAPVAVRVVDDRPAVATLVSPSGWRIEGLTLDEVRVLVSA